MIPTPRLLLLLLLGAVLIAGTALSRPLLWLAIIYLALVSVLVVVDLLISPRPRQIDVERINDTRLSIGASNLVTILLTNASPRPIRFQLRDEYPHQFQCASPFASGTIGPYDLAEVRYHLRPVQRGDYRFGDTNLRYDSVLRMYRQQARYPTSAPVKVYPNVLEIRKYDLLARRGLLYEIGLRATRVYGPGSEFERLRDYTSDDEFRRINWKASARRGKPIAVEYETERSQYVMSVLDTGRLMRAPVGDLARLDYALNTALLLSYVATLKGDHIGMLTFDDRVGTYLAPKRGRGQFYRMLEALYKVQLQAVEPDYARALSYLEVKHKRRSLIVIFTDLTTPDAARPLIARVARLAQRHLVMCVVISDPGVVQLAERAPASSSDLYQRAVAEMLLDERRVVLETMQNSGVQTIDVPADRLTVSVINRYLELKGRGAL